MCECLVSFPDGATAVVIGLQCSTNADYLYAQAALVASVALGELTAIAPCLSSLSSSVYSLADELRRDGASFAA